MGLPVRRFLLDEGTRHRGNVAFLSGLPAGFQLNGEKRTSWVTLTRTGRWKHPIYSEFEITLGMFQAMIKNFENDTLGQKIFIDIGHRPDDGAAGEIVELSIEGNRLRGRVVWTDFGIKQVSDKGFRYMSVDFVDDYKDPETDAYHGPLLFGAALTTRPFVKRLDPVELSEEFTPPGGRVLMHTELRRQLSDIVETSMKKYLKKLREQLEARKLSANVVDQLVDAAEQAMKAVGEDEKALSAIVDKFDATGKTLADSIGDKEIKLSIDLPKPAPQQEGGEGGDGDAPKQLSEKAVADIVAKQLKAAEDAAAEKQRKLDEGLEARKKVLSDTIGAAENLSDEQKTQLTEQVEDLITPDMPEESVRKLADFQLSQASQLAAAQQLSALGYQNTRAGSPNITIDDANGIKQLSGAIRENLAKTSKASSGELRLAKEEPAFCQMVLAEFDRLHAPRLDHERRIMLAGEVDTGRTDLPVSFQREVIREALSDLRVLELVQKLTDFGATATTQIPYEVRDDVNSILNDGVVFEGQGIPNSGVEQKMDLAYILPMKLALKITNEVLHFTRQSAINWDAFGRNVASNARHMRELLARRIANELQRVADSFQAADIANEDISAALDGSNSIVTLAQFPVVRPFQTRDLKGNAVGTEENPITVAFGSTVERWDGSGTQSAGTYWRPYNLNLGQIQFVDETGAPATPNEATATVSYSHATNVTKFDIKVPSGTELEVHLNGALRAIGSSKALLRSERFVEPNFNLMSPVLNDTITNARQFEAQARRDGTGTDPMGDLERVKGIDSWSTNAPNVDLGDERVLMGIRGQLSYVQAKPWQMISQPFEAVDSNNRPTGEKVAYGEEYSAIHVPVPLRGRMRSVLLYNSDDRA